MVRHNGWRASRCKKTVSEISRREINMSRDTYCVEGKGRTACVPEYPDIDPPNEDSKVPNRKKFGPPIDHGDPHVIGDQYMPPDDWHDQAGRYSTGLSQRFTYGLWNPERDNDIENNLKLDDKLQPLEPGTFVPMARGEHSDGGAKSEKAGSDKGAQNEGNGNGNKVGSDNHVTIEVFPRGCSLIRDK